MKPRNCHRKFITALKGLLKVMSKMGVSTIRSYRGAQSLNVGSMRFHRCLFFGHFSRIAGSVLMALRGRSLRGTMRMFKSDEEKEALDSGGAILYRRFLSAPVHPEAIYCS